MEFHFHEGIFNFPIVNRLSSVLIKSITLIRTLFTFEEIIFNTSSNKFDVQCISNKQKTPLNGYMYIVDVKCVWLRTVRMEMECSLKKLALCVQVSRLFLGKIARI